MNQNENDDFDAKFAAVTERAGQAADQGFGALTKALQEAIAMQAGEIERLRGVLSNATEIPPRHFERVSVTSAQDGSRTRRDVVALASDRSAWAMFDIPTHPDAFKHHAGWLRLPALPQAADEMNAAAKGAE